ncbi:MAG: hypothetical protein AMXMBFR82_29110 [Candidatus Hydrogenedentota bacterium]
MGDTDAHKNTEADDYWKALVQVHQHTKDLYLVGEESNPELKTWLQPIREQRDALEHIVRSQARAYDIRSNADGQDPATPNEDDATEDAEYIKSNLRHALGHEVRAFFDVADYLCIVARDNITKSMSDYENKAIADVFPSYYTEIRPDLESISKNIAKIRQKKDIAEIAECNELVVKYKDVVLTVLSKSESVSTRIPALEEYTRKNRVKQIRDYSVQFVIGFVLVIFAAVLGYIFGANS